MNVALKVVSLVVIAFFLACSRGIPDAGSPDHKESLRAFYVGLAAAEVGDDRRARAELLRSVEISPGEPAAWNNLGVLHLRHRELDESLKALETASYLAPANPRITLNMAVLHDQRGESERSIEFLELTSKHDPDDAFSRFLLANESERRNEDVAALGHLNGLSEILPENIALKLEIARVASKLGRNLEVDAAIVAIAGRQETFSEEAQEQFRELKIAAGAGDGRTAANRISFLRNVLLREPWFRNELAAFRPSETSIGLLISKPIVIPAPEFKPAPPDTTLAFNADSIDPGSVLFTKAIFPDGESEPRFAISDGEVLKVGNETLLVAVQHPEQVAEFDFNYDFRNDLAVASSSGFKLYAQLDSGDFKDVTAESRLPASVVDGSFSGIWAFDIEHDGDLDLLAASAIGPPIVLRNNGDGTFEAIQTFDLVKNVKDFLFADLDEDGDSDAVFLTQSGDLTIFRNKREGIFERIDAAFGDRVDAIAVADLAGSARLDLVVLENEVLSALRFSSPEFSVERRQIANVEGISCESVCRLFVGDLDNNGAADILVSDGKAARVLLGRADGGFDKIPEFYARTISGIADFDGNGRLDLIGLDQKGSPTVFRNQSQAGYHWQIIRPRAAKAEGDQRVNSFGIGGEMELRSGLHAQRRLIASPQVHFGLGENNTSDVLRVIWGNGLVQAEFDLSSDQVVAAEQRLKGSCPHLFTWNGSKFVLVKDAPPWSPALGLKINAQDTYGILQTEEWFKIPGEKLKPRDGFYDLRITGEYWESFYLDNYQLLAVDRREDTEIFTDERFAIPLPPLEVFTTGPLNEFASATDHNGSEVTGVLQHLDEKYLDGIRRGRFQGIAEDHWVTLELPEHAPANGKLWLVGDGWVHPTDASINVQRGQGVPQPPKSLSLEVESPDGKWTTVSANLGFPAGKMKTVLIDLTGIFPADRTVRRFRLRTEMEIYWDRLAWAVGIEKPETQITRMNISDAELRYRGFSVIDKPNASSPEKPIYDQILTTGQRWRDLEGYYTRFGDVTELLANTDGRMVLMNAGDELILRFKELPPPAQGWKRDFVIIGNGWIKDGDLNSTFSRTLLPLPTHETNEYSRRPTRLEDDPVYQKHRSDWERFHTRYVSTDGFRDSLRAR
jgi:Tfp pilus assembly protein PilF